MERLKVKGQRVKDIGQEDHPSIQPERLGGLRPEDPPPLAFTL
jgi:hypothetical protein